MEVRYWNNKHYVCMDERHANSNDYPVLVKDGLLGIFREPKRIEGWLPPD